MAGVKAKKGIVVPEVGLESLRSLWRRKNKTTIKKSVSTKTR